MPAPVPVPAPDLSAAHPAVLIVTALVGAGLLKSLEKCWSAWLRTRKADADPRSLQGWLVTEVKFLRQDLAEQRRELGQEREQHKQCRIDLARLEERLIGLHDEVKEIRGAEAFPVVPRSADPTPAPVTTARRRRKQSADKPEKEPGNDA